MTVFRVPSPPPLGEDCGPDYWTKRRAEWLQSPSEGKPKEYNGQRSTDPDPQQKLVDILDEPGAAENDAYWFGGLQRIWKALIGCASVKHPLPLRTATRLLHTGWLRDGTWPRGAAAATSTDEEPSRPQLPPPNVSATPHLQPAADDPSSASTVDV